MNIFLVQCGNPGPLGQFRVRTALPLGFFKSNFIKVLNLFSSGYCGYGRIIATSSSPLRGGLRRGLFRFYASSLIF